MHVLVIDSNLKRREKLKTFIERNRHRCTAFSQVNGMDSIGPNTVWGSIRQDCQNLIKSDSFSLLLIHHNSNQNPFWDHFVQMFCEKEGKWCLSYSGGERAKDLYERHHAFAGNVNDNGEAGWELAGFLEAVENGNDDPFNVLVLFDPLLEAKLELLHLCMTPEGQPDAERVFEEVYQLSEDKEKLQAAFMTMQAGMASPRAGDFDGGYSDTINVLSKALLSS